MVWENFRHENTDILGNIEEEKKKMYTEIYYFSGTGNCLYVAKKIGEINNYRIKSIPDFMKREEVLIQSDCIILVFPSYLAAACGIPLIVERFVKKIDKIKLKKIIAVCTCGGYEIVNANPSLIKLKKIIKSVGGELSSRYSLRFPMNNLDYAHIPVPIEKNTNIILEKAELKLKKINNQIAREQKQRIKIIQSIFYYLMTPVFYLMKSKTLESLRKYAKEEDRSLNCSELMSLTDRSIKINENCIGCGICARICPVNNIEIKNGKPEFKHNCEVCFACDEWCPQGAIQHWSRAVSVKYHHPKIQREDMYGEKGDI